MVDFKKPQTVGEALQRAASGETKALDWLTTREGKQVTAVSHRNRNPYKFLVEAVGTHSAYSVTKEGEQYERSPSDTDILLTVPDWYTEPEEPEAVGPRFVVVECKTSFAERRTGIHDRHKNLFASFGLSREMLQETADELNKEPEATKGYSWIPSGRFEILEDEEAKPEPTTVAEALAAGRCDLLACDYAGKPVSIEPNAGMKILPGHAKPYLYSLKFISDGREEGGTYTDCGKLNQNNSTKWDLKLVANADIAPEPTTVATPEVPAEPPRPEIPADQWQPDLLVTSDGCSVYSCGFIGQDPAWRWVVFEDGGIPRICDRHGSVVGDDWFIKLKPRKPLEFVATAKRPHGGENGCYVFDWPDGPWPTAGKKYRIIEVMEGEV